MLKLQLSSELASLFQKTPCQARMREIVSDLHIPKTTTMCHMYEANYSD